MHFSIGTLSLCLAIVVGATEPAKKPVFSGPQVGERLPPFKVRGVLDNQAGRELSPVKSWQAPTVLIFVHELTRPAVRLTRTVMQYAATRKPTGLQAAVVFLADDAPALEKRLQRARRALPLEATIGISNEGREGPGSYGLNRGVMITALLASEGIIAANFAIVQPTAAVDAPKIAQEIVKLVGGKAPTLAQLGLQRNPRKNRPKANGKKKKGGRSAQDLSPKMQTLLRQMIQKTNSPQDVQRIAAQIEQNMKGNTKTREVIGSIAWRVQDLGYGNPTAQQQLREWAQKYAPQDVRKTPPARPQKKKKKNRREP